MTIEPLIHSNLEEELLATLQSVLTCLHSRDTYTADHSLRVADYAVRIGKRLRLPEESLAQLYAGALLHDIGKLTFSDRVFEEASTELTEEMTSQIRRHPVTGAAILYELGHNGTIRDCVLYHHERLDGSGYPYGLKDDQIPLTAQIVSIADTFDAMTTDRPYHLALVARQGLNLLLLERDDRFAFELVQALIAEFHSPTSLS